MRANPNDPLRPYIRRGDLVTIIIPPTTEDVWDLAHEISAVVGDLTHTPVDDFSQASAFVLVGEATYPAGPEAVSGALGRIAARYGLEKIVWTYGPKVEAEVVHA